MQETTTERIPRIMREKKFNQDLNPDQSVAMYSMFKEVFDVCEWKGFKPEDTVKFLLAAIEDGSMLEALKANLALDKNCTS